MKNLSLQMKMDNITALNNSINFNTKLFVYQY